MIIYFSGTGNTRMCAIELAKLLGEDVHELSPDELCKPSTICLDFPSERVIWAFPTYSWGVPPVVVRFIKEVRLGERAVAATHYMLTTCGDDMGYTDRQWRRLMERRGLVAADAYCVIMPNTYVLMKGFELDSPEVARGKVKASHDRLEEIAAAITGGGGDMLVRGAYPWIKSRVIYPWFIRFAMSPKPFHAIDSCTGCGQCRRSCPMANISISDDRRPRWGKDCALCLRCYHGCPHHAIRYGKR